jgi:hypothetical protein
MLCWIQKKARAEVKHYRYFHKNSLIILFLIVSLSVFSQSSLAASHSLYSAFSSPENRVSYDVDSLFVEDSIIYKTAFYSINGSAWVSFNLSGALFNNDSNSHWLANSASRAVLSFGAGEHYLIVYSCTLENSTWNCHDNKWQMMILNNMGSSGNTTNITNTTSNSTNATTNTTGNTSIDDGLIGSCSDGVQNQGEAGIDCGGSCIDCIEIADYYVAVNGSDSSSGTSLDAPWATWQKAFNSAKPGDLVYFMGGVYYSNGARYGNSGTADNPIRFFAYPGQTPILDGSNKPATNWNYGIQFQGYPSNTHFKGLEIRNFIQRNPGEYVIGIVYDNAKNITFENVVVHDIGGPGFMGHSGIGKVSFINCDSYNNFDLYNGVILSDGKLYTGGGAPGFGLSSDSNDAYYYVEGCRAWNNSDGGINPGHKGFAVVNNSWAFLNGYANGDGDGFKGYGYGVSNFTTIRRTILNTISAENRVGYDQNNDPDIWLFYNNFAYNNGYNLGPSQHILGGFYFCFANLESIFKNNLIFNNTLNSTANTMDKNGNCFGSRAIQSYNSWNRAVTVTADDFLSLDVYELVKPRNANGSLPDVDFGKLAPGSDLIDAGVFIEGYHCTTAGEHPGENCRVWYGSAPDIGPFEFKP